MKKLKILLLALAATISVDAWADTTILSNEKGWAKITTMPEDPSKYFFALVDNNADLMMGLAQGNHQESGFKTMYYQTSANPTTDLSKLWFIEAMSDVSNYKSCYTFRNVSYNIWAFQTEWNNAQFFRTHDQFFPIEWTATIPKYDDTNKYWTIQNGRYPSDGYLGAWENVDKADGVECALNVPIDNSRIGHFQIYSILKSDFIKLYANGEKNKDITFMLLNPSFENGHTYGWTQDGTKSLGPQGNADFGKDGNTYAEHWQPNGTINMYQEIHSMPSGTYKVSFQAKARGITSASLYANTVKTTLKIANEENTYEASIILDDNSTLKVGIEAVGTGAENSWVACDNFQLTLVEAGLPAVTKAEGKMNKDVSDAQDAAVKTYNDNKTVANYNAALAAIEAAKASIAAYNTIKVALDKADILDEAGQNKFGKLSATIQSNYNSGAIADADCPGTVKEIYSMLNVAAKVQTTEGADMTLAIVNPEINGADGWTCEKPNGGNGPLLNGESFEYWIETASNGSFDYYQVINGLPNGHYNIGVQMYNSSNGVSGDTPNGNVGLYGFANNTQKFVGCTIDEMELRSYTLKDVVVTDGTLRLGVKNNGTMGARWFVADKFTLTFVSGMTEIDAALIALNTVLDQAKALIDANATATVSLKNKIADDYTTYKAYTSSTGIDVIKAATTDMAAQIAALNASITDYAKLKDAIDNYYYPVDPNYDNLESVIAAAKEHYEKADLESCSECIASLSMSSDAVKAAMVNDYMYVTGTEENLGKYIYGVSLGEWTRTGYVSTFSNEHWSETTHDYMNQDDSNGRGWNSPTGFEIGLNQNVTLPAGNYVFKACGRKSGDAVLELLVKSGDNVIGRVANFPSSNNAKGIDKDGVTSFDGDNFANSGNGFGWQWRYVAFTLEKEATINVAVSASATTKYQWVSFGDYTIQTDNEANLAMIAYNIALNDAKLAKENDAYKNVTGAELTALNTAMAFETAGKTKTEIDEATAALQDATSAFKAAAPAYDNYKAVLAKVENLDDAGKAKFNEIAADINGKYGKGTIWAADLANVTDFYIAAVKAQTTPNTDWTVLIKNNSFETGNIDGWINDGVVKLGALNTSPANNPKVGDWFVEKYWGEGSIDFNQTINDLPVGYYKVTVHARNEADAKAYLYANDEKVAFVKNTTDTYSVNVVIAKTGALKIGVSCENHINGVWLAVDHFTLTYLGATANMTITDANWGTFCAPFDVTIPEGVKAYTAAAEGNSVAFTEVTTIPAGTPVVVYSATEVNEEFNGKATATGETCTSGVLVGVYAATSDIEAATGYTNYVLQSNTQGVGFYKVAEGSTISLNANRCYMTLATSFSAKDCVVLDGIVTGINNILNPTDKSAEGIYDLNGRKLAAPQKGINIINGVKVIVK